MELEGPGRPDTAFSSKRALRVDASTSVEQYSVCWFEQMRWLVKSQTHSNYSGIIKNHILTGTPTAPCLPGATTLRGMLSAAVDDGLLTANAFHGLGARA